MGIFGNTFGWPHLLIILAVILLLFGAARLPALARSIGQSTRIFRGEMKAMKGDDPKASEPEEAAPADGATLANEAVKKDAPSRGTTTDPQS